MICLLYINLTGKLSALLILHQDSNVIIVKGMVLEYQTNIPITVVPIEKCPSLFLI